MTVTLTKETLELINDDTNVDVQSRLKTIATLLEGKLTVLKDLDDKTLALCTLEDVEHGVLFFLPSGESTSGKINNALFLA